MLHLSQGLLNLLTLCPRKFQYTYLEQLNVPIAPDQQDRINWGNRFHLLMQQQALGLRLNPAVEGFPEDQQMHDSVACFIQSVPELFQPDSDTPLVSGSSRQSEHARSLQFQGYLFTVIYDLLLLDQHHAQILDWKTYPRPQNPDRLLQNWQTRLYPFVLAETSPYAPHQISMTYWFVQPQVSQAQMGQDQADLVKPQCFKFSYSAAQHQQTYQDLTLLLQQFTADLQRYQTTHQPFPQTPSPIPCQHCAFALRCQRGSTRQDEAPLVTLEEIPEVAL